MSTNFNEHMRLAQAMIHGHLYIDPAPPWMEHITVNGHDYILHGPLSAFICLPFVAVGITDQRFICCVLGVISTFLCYRLTRSGWLTSFFVCGTTFLYECSNGASWDFALVATTPFTFAALIFVGEGPSRALDKANSALNLEGGPSPFLVGLFAGLAALARYDLMLAWPVYLWMIWRQDNENERETRKRIFLLCRYRLDYKLLLGFVGPLVGVSLVYIWFNEARFGTLTDGSISEWFWHYDALRARRPYGPFSIHYMPFNLFTLLWMGPSYQGGFPWLRPQYMGQALLSLSPAFLLVKWSPWLMAAMLTSLPALTVYASGFSQLGSRYYVQCYPMLLAAMMQRPLGTEGKALIIASIILSMTATCIVWTYGLA